MIYKQALNYINFKKNEFYYEKFIIFISKLFRVFIEKSSTNKDLKEGWKRRIIISTLLLGSRIGIVDCSLLLGKIYLNNRIFPKSDYDAAYWLYKAAIVGHPEAQYFLGSLYLSGLPLQKISLEYQKILWVQFAQPNFEEGTRWLRKAVEQGHTLASGKLGDLLINGPQDKRNTEEGLRLLLFSAKNGLSSAQFSIGNFFIMTASDDASMRRVAASYVSQSASQGYPAAVYVKGLLLESGFGIVRDRKAAAMCFKAASEFNIPEAMRKYATELISGEFFPKNLLLTETILRKAALSGDLQSAKMLSKYYGEGFFFRKDPIQASFWKQKTIFLRQKTTLTL